MTAELSTQLVVTMIRVVSAFVPPDIDPFIRGFAVGAGSGSRSGGIRDIQRRDLSVTLLSNKIPEERLYACHTLTALVSIRYDKRVVSWSTLSPSKTTPTSRFSLNPYLVKFALPR